MTSNGHPTAKVFLSRSIQRIQDTETVVFVKRVDVEIPEDRIIEATERIGIEVTNVTGLTGKDGKTSTRTLRVTLVDVPNRNTFVRNGLQVDCMHFEAEAVLQNTEWPKRHDTEIKINFLPYKSTKEVDLSTNERGTSKLYIHTKMRWKRPMLSTTTGIKKMFLYITH